jgi:hypothetical protein
MGTASKKARSKLMLNYAGNTTYNIWNESLCNKIVACNEKLRQWRGEVNFCMSLALSSYLDEEV